MILKGAAAEAAPLSFERGSAMRRLMFFTIGFAAACVFCAYAWQIQGLYPLALISLLLCCACMIGLRWTRLMRYPAVALLGLAVGFFWFQLYSDQYLSKANEMDGQIADVTARCTDYGYDTGYGTACDGYLYLEGKPVRARFYVSGQIEMEPGDVLTGAFKMKVTTPEGEVGNRSHQGKGIFLLCYQVEDAQLAKLAAPPGWAYPSILRGKLLKLVETLFPEDTFAFAKALLLGERSDLDYETYSSLQTAGIMHIVAVSGLHVTILFTLLNMICLKRRWLLALVGIPVLACFAVVGGFSPSVIRACIMQALIIIAMLFSREYDGPTELSFACLVMLLANPLVITSVSFQLSVGCMIGIFAFQSRISHWILEKLEHAKTWKRLKHWFAQSVSMTLSAMSLTTPLVAYYFGLISLIGVMTNLLTLWVISLIFYGIMVVCLLGWFLPSAGSVLAWLISWPIRYVLGVAKVLAAFPLAAVYTRSIYIVFWLAFCYVLLGVFLVMRDKRPGLLAACAALTLCICVAASWIEPLTDSCRMTVLDVGQGQSIILQNEGKTFLVDCGGSYDEDAANLAADTLLSQGIGRVDGIIVTHYDRDHAGGIGYLLSRIRADVLIMPDDADDSGTRAGLENQMKGQVSLVQNDVELSYGSTHIRIFGPVLPDSGNESSLAVLFSAQNCDILITGDRSDFGERMLMKTAELPDLEILVAGHHGAKGSTCEELLAATMPEIVVISVGDNPYGHPAQELLERLDHYGCTVYRTDIHGTIILRR